MWSGTLRVGLTIPGRTRPSSERWQRLYLRPLPHQHGSLEAGRAAGGVELPVMASEGYGAVARSWRAEHDLHCRCAMRCSASTRTSGGLGAISTSGTSRTAGHEGERGGACEGSTK